MPYCAHNFFEFCVGSSRHGGVAWRLLPQEEWVVKFGGFGFLVSSQNLPFSVEHLALKMGISPLHDWAAPAFARCIWNCIHPRPRYHMLALDLQPLERRILLTLVASLEPSLSKMPYCDDDDLKGEEQRRGFLSCSYPNYFSYSRVGDGLLLFK